VLRETGQLAEGKSFATLPSMMRITSMRSCARCSALDGRRIRRTARSVALDRGAGFTDVTVALWARRDFGGSAPAAGWPGYGVVRAVITR